MGAFLVEYVVSFGFFVSHGVPFVHDAHCTGHRGALSSGVGAGLRAGEGDGQRWALGVFIAAFFEKNCLPLTLSPLLLQKHRGALSSGDCAGLRADGGDGQRMDAGPICDFLFLYF